MNGYALAFHLLCSSHLILSIITVGKYCPAFFRASVWIFLMKLKLQRSLLMM